MPGLDYNAFQMATAILLGVTGVSRAGSLVLDIQDSYFDRLLLTPVRRTAILLGHMAADVGVAAALTVPIIVLGLIIGVRFEAGPLGIVVFIAVASLWSLAFAGFGYAIALKTGNPAAVNSTFLLFFPFLFLTPAYVPRQELSGWLQHRRRHQPRHLHPGGAAFGRPVGRLALDPARAGAARHRHRRGDQHGALLRRPAGPHQAGRQLRSGVAATDR